MYFTYFDCVLSRNRSCCYHLLCRFVRYQNIILFKKLLEINRSLQSRWVITLSVEILLHIYTRASIWFNRSAGCTNTVYHWCSFWSEDSSIDKCNPEPHSLNFLTKKKIFGLLLVWWTLDRFRWCKCSFNRKC